MNLLHPFIVARYALLLQLPFAHQADNLQRARIYPIQ